MNFDSHNSNDNSVPNPGQTTIPSPAVDDVVPLMNPPANNQVMDQVLAHPPTVVNTDIPVLEDSTIPVSQPIAEPFPLSTINNDRLESVTPVVEPVISRAVSSTSDIDNTSAPPKKTLPKGLLIAAAMLILSASAIGAMFYTGFLPQRQSEILQGAPGDPCVEESDCSSGNTCSFGFCVPCSSISNESECWTHSSCAWINGSCRANTAPPTNPGVSITGTCDSFTVTGGCVQLAVAQCSKSAESQSWCLAPENQLVGCATSTQTFCEGTHSIPAPGNQCSVWQIDASGSGFSCSKTGCNWEESRCNIEPSPDISPTPTAVPEPMTCLDLNASKNIPQRGDVVTYTCSGSGEEASYANFRLLKGDVVVPPIGSYISLDSNKTANWSYTLSNNLEAGIYKVQCQICSGNTTESACTNWAQAN